MTDPSHGQAGWEPEPLQIEVPERKLAPILPVSLGRLEHPKVVLEARGLEPRGVIGEALRR